MMLSKINFKLTKVLIIFLIILSCTKKTKKQLFYNNGKLFSSYYIDEKGFKNGVVYEYDTLGVKNSELYYHHGILDSIKSFYSTGNVDKITYIKKDSILIFNYNEKNELIKKVRLKNTQYVIENNYTIINKEWKKKYGWIEYYKNGKLLKKSNIITVKSIPKSYENMRYVYNKNGVIDKSRSIFFSLEMPDTLSVGEPYIGEFKFHSNINSKNVLGYYTIISDKLSKCFENINTLKDLDTFYVATPGFRYIPKSVGKKTLRIKILEKYMIITPSELDTTQVTIRITHRPFFYEKNIFINTPADTK